MKIKLSFLSLLFCYSLYAIFIAKPEAPFLTVVGFVKMADGLGRQCPDMIEALHEDFSIGFMPLRDNDMTDVPESIRTIVEKPNPSFGKVIFLNDTPWKPSKKNRPYGALRVLATRANKDELRICYTMLESSKIPEEWVDVLNTYFDAVAVPDPFLETVFAESGVTIPVFTLPLGLNLTRYLQAPIKKSQHMPFRFACMGSLTDRKNQAKLAMAFDRAFNKDPKIELYIHARFSDRSYKDHFFETLEALNNSQIKFEESRIDNESYFKLFQSVDLLVNVSKGEGFSIQPREAMALGIPVLLTENTAQISIIKNSPAVAVTSDIKVPAYYSTFKKHIGDFSDFQVEELAIKLRECYANYGALLGNSEGNRNYAAQFQYEAVKPLYRNIISPKTIKLSQVNRVTAEGLETSSPELLRKYMRLTGAKLCE